MKRFSRRKESPDGDRPHAQELSFGDVFSPQDAIPFHCRYVEKICWEIRSLEVRTLCMYAIAGGFVRHVVGRGSSLGDVTSVGISCGPRALLCSCGKGRDIAMHAISRVGVVILNPEWMRVLWLNYVV